MRRRTVAAVRLDAREHGRPAPLIAYYRDRGILVEVDGNQSPEEITAEIQARLAGR